MPDDVYSDLPQVLQDLLHGENDTGTTQLLQEGYRQDDISDRLSRPPTDGHPQVHQQSSSEIDDETEQQLGLQNSEEDTTPHGFGSRSDHTLELGLQGASKADSIADQHPIIFPQSREDDDSITATIDAGVQVLQTQDLAYSQWQERADAENDLEDAEANSYDYSQSYDDPDISEADWQEFISQQSREESQEEYV